MSIPHMELFYEGYDPQWVLGKDKGPPVETKPKPPAQPAKNQPPAPIDLKVPFCCEECERKMSSHLIQQDGVESVKLDSSNGKVTVTGKVKPDDCLKEAKKIVRRTEFWPKKKDDKKDDGAKKDDPKKK